MKYVLAILEIHYKQEAKLRIFVQNTIKIIFRLRSATTRLLKVVVDNRTKQLREQIDSSIAADKLTLVKKPVCFYVKTFQRKARQKLGFWFRNGTEQVILFID